MNTLYRAYNQNAGTTVHVRSPWPATAHASKHALHGIVPQQQEQCIQTCTRCIKISKCMYTNTVLSSHKGDVSESDPSTQNTYNNKCDQ
jgi:hypothetical protein